MNKVSKVNEKDIKGALSLLGIAKKAGRLEAGEDCVGAAAQACRARLILTATDAAENTLRRAEGFAREGKCLISPFPADKAALGGALGRGPCALLAVTDTGLALAVANRLAAGEAERYGPLAERLARKAERAAARKKEPRRRAQKLGKKQAAFQGPKGAEKRKK